MRCFYINVVNDNQEDIWIKYVLKHENEIGVSHARNVGLDIAHGEYIAFVDNDDDIADTYLHLLYQAMRQNNSQYDFCIIPSYSDNQLIKNYNDIDLTNLR